LVWSPADVGSDALDPSSPDPATRRLLGDWLAVQDALALRPQVANELLARHRGPAEVLRHLPGSRGRRTFDRSRAIRALARAGAQALPYGAKSYPQSLRELSDPPALLLVRGAVASLSGLSVAIVGSRAATHYGRSVAHTLGFELARAGCTIVSGLARGIDADAHRGALEAAGQTVAVLACGIEQVYPPEHRRLAGQIAERGAVIGELPIGTPPRRGFFPLRNRLISGLCRAVVIVEARTRSGTLITAAHAADQGREVFAVPGPIHAPTSEGTNRLLADGAHPALGAEAILETLGWVAESAAEERPARPVHGLAGEILRALDEAPATRDELASRLDRPFEQLALDLLELELTGRVAQDRDGRLCCAPRRG
jgi:DNA processing protein